MKKLFSLLILALISTQMWAVTYTATYTRNSKSYTMTAYDMGTNDNVFWGDRCLGEKSTNKQGVGDYYRYGDPTALGNAASSYSYSGLYIKRSSTVYVIPADKDPATVELGEGWRMPTSAEYATLINKATFSRTSSSSNYASAVANGNTIYFYYGGQKSGYSVSYAGGGSSSYARYWTSTKKTASDAYCLSLTYGSDSKKGYITSKDGAVTASQYLGYLVKPVYDTQTYTLTVKADGSTSSTYTGKWGKTTTSITASKTGHTFTQWDDGNTSNPRTFKICDITYTAQFTASKYNIIYEDQGGGDYSGNNLSSLPSKHTYGTATTLVNGAKDNYTFVGWYTNSDCTSAKVTSLGATAYTGTITLYAKWEANAVTNYTLAWDADGGELSGTYTAAGDVSGGASITAPTATRTGYTFNGWLPDFNGTMPSDDVTYTAQWTPNTNTAYTVKHYKQNLALNGYDLADTDNLTGTTATNVTPDVKNYEGFIAPATQTVSILADGSRVVEYNYTRNKYTVTVESNNTGYGTVDVASVENVPYGTTITTSTNTIDVNGTTVTATPATVTGYTCTFSNWTNGTAIVTGALTVTANFSQTENNYSVTFRKSADDQNPAVKSDYHYGDEITNRPATDPQRLSDDTHTYTFIGWHLEGTENTYSNAQVDAMTVSGNMMFTARFEEQIIEVVPVTYNVTIGSFAANGKVIITSQDNVREITATGATLTFDAGKSLTIQAVPNAYYHFAGWTEDNDEEAVIDIRTLNKDLTYTPTFAANEPLTLEDTHNEAYYSELYSQHDGDVLTVTLANRQLTEGNWITFCAPFDFIIPAGHPFYGTAYQLQNATMSGTNTSAYISLDFRRTYEIRANVPYLIVPTMTTVSNLEFDGVTIEEAPTVRTTAAQSGQVEFVSVPWQTKITNDATKPNIYLASGNTLRYVSTSGTTFRAFRAYFHRLVNLGAPRRMVISLDGVETTKQLTEDGEVTDTTEKRLENGVLIIERNGVRYDAQGKRL